MSGRRPGRVLRLLFRLPVGLFRARLGWMLAGRMLMLVTVGRTSGLPRRVVLEVVKADRAYDRYWVVAGYGRGSDWYRNALATPPILVDTGFRRFRPAVHELDAAERLDLLTEYQARNPRLAAALGERLLGVEFSGDESALREAAEALGALRLEPAV